MCLKCYVHIYIFDNWVSPFSRLRNLELCEYCGDRKELSFFDHNMYVCGLQEYLTLIKLLGYSRWTAHILIIWQDHSCTSNTDIPFRVIVTSQGGNVAARLALIGCPGTVCRNNRNGRLVFLNKSRCDYRLWKGALVRNDDFAFNAQSFDKVGYVLGFGDLSDDHLAATAHTVGLKRHPSTAAAGTPCPISEVLSQGVNERWFSILVWHPEKLSVKSTGSHSRIS